MKSDSKTYWAPCNACTHLLVCLSIYYKRAEELKKYFSPKPIIPISNLMCVLFFHVTQEVDCKVEQPWRTMQIPKHVCLPILHRTIAHSLSVFLHQKVLPVARAHNASCASLSLFSPPIFISLSYQRSQSSSRLISIVDVTPPLRLQLLSIGSMKMTGGRRRP